MSRVCDLTGKTSIGGNKVSHSNHKSKRRFHPNLQEKSFYIPEQDCWIRLKVCAKAIRTINKKGISVCLKDAELKGLIKL